MAKETKTNSVEKAEPVVGKAVTERLSTQLTGVHSTFSLLLDEIQTNNKLSNGLTLAQLKFERDIDKEAVKGEEQNNKMIKGLKEINETLKSIKKSSTGSALGSKDSAVSAGLPKAATNLTLTEKLKSVVGGVKSAGNKFMKAGGNVVGSVTDALTDPGAAIKKAYGSSRGVIKGALGTAKDILSTKADYSVEQERFATAFSKTGRGGLMQGKKTGKEVGAEAFNKLKAKQEEIEKQKAVLKPFEEQGFAPVGEKKKLAKLQKELADMDPRVQKEKAEVKSKKVVEKKQEAENRIDKVEEKEDVAEVKAEKTTRKKAAVEGKVSSKAEKDPSKVSAPSGSEDLLKEIQANNVTLGSLLSVTQTQLISINAIKDALAPSTPKELTEQKSAPSSTNEKEGGNGGKGLADVASQALDLIPEKGGKPAAGKGIGSKIKGAFKGMSGLAKGTAGLSVAMGAYDAYSNFKDAGEEGQAKLEQIDADVKAGKITPKEAEDLKKQTNEATVEKKGEGIGAGAGTAIGGTLGAIAGSVLGPVGTVAGGYLGAKAGEFIGGKVGKLGGQVANFFSGNKDTPIESAAPSTTTTTSTTSESKTRIAGEDVGEKLSDRQMAVIGMSKASGNSYSPEIEAMYSKQKEATVTPAGATPSSGSTVAKTSTENNDMEREAGNKSGGNSTVVSNNVSSNNTTKFVPMKANPRPEYTGSSLDRYTNRITVY